MRDRPALGLAHLPTPLEPMDRLAAALVPGGRGPRLLVKRDDCTGLALGGNKARKLEHLCREALAQECDVLVTGGGPQSNHVRMTGAAANRLGLECHVVLAASDRDPTAESGNVLLDALLGIHLHVIDGRDYDDIEAGIEQLAARLAREGRRPYAIPVGGASVTGVMAYADAADELRAQLGNERVDWVVVADGSGGTHAGLLAGFGDDVRVLGVDVGTRPDLLEVVPRLAATCAERTGRPAPPDAIDLDVDHFGTGYGAITDSALEAMTLAARTEGLVLDPETVVFWHTGGAPALFATRYAACCTPTIERDG